MLNASQSGLVAWLLRAVVSPRGQPSARCWTLVDVLPSQLRIVLQLWLSSFLKPMSSCYPDHYNFWFLHPIASQGCEVVNSFSVLLWFATAARIAWSPKSWADVAQASFNPSSALGCMQQEVCKLRVFSVGCTRVPKVRKIRTGVNVFQDIIFNLESPRYQTCRYWYSEAEITGISPYQKAHRILQNHTEMWETKLATL